MSSSKVPKIKPQCWGIHYNPKSTTCAKCPTQASCRHTLASSRQTKAQVKTSSIEPTIHSDKLLKLKIEFYISGDFQRKIDDFDGLDGALTKYYNSEKPEEEPEIRDEIFLSLLSKAEQLCDAQEFEKARKFLDCVNEVSKDYVNSPRYQEIYETMLMLDDVLCKKGYP